MDYTTVFAVWTVAITGPCVISWLVGDLAGSTRTRQLYTDGVGALEPITGQDQEASAFLVEQWRVKGSIHPLAEGVSLKESEAPPAPTFEEQAIEAERRRVRRASLASRVERMSTEWAPAIVDPEPNVIESACAVSDPSRVLRQYARSVESLQRRNREIAFHG